MMPDVRPGWLGAADLVGCSIDRGAALSEAMALLDTMDAIDVAGPVGTVFDVGLSESAPMMDGFPTGQTFNAMISEFST